MSDNVKHPKHYETHLPGIETIDIIFALLGPDGFRAYCKGNVIKYLARYEQKGGEEDLRKAQVYLRWMTDYSILGEEAID
jgi:hypothetical protein